MAVCDHSQSHQTGIEIQYQRLRQLLFASLNRTKLELKYMRPIWQKEKNSPLNRTKLELKYVQIHMELRSGATLNRTKLELKWQRAFMPQYGYRLSIAPNWN